MCCSMLFTKKRTDQLLFKVGGLNAWIGIFNIWNIANPVTILFKCKRKQIPCAPQNYTDKSGSLKRSHHKELCGLNRNTRLFLSSIPFEHLAISKWGARLPFQALCSKELALTLSESLQRARPFDKHIGIWKSFKKWHNLPVPSAGVQHGCLWAISMLHFRITTNCLNEFDLDLSYVNVSLIWISWESGMDPALQDLCCSFWLITIK